MKKTKKIIWLVIGILIIIIIVGQLFFNKKNSVEYTTADVTQGELIQTVSETGTIKPAHELELSFINSDKLSKLIAKVGDKVKKDQILAELDNTSILIKQREANASLMIAQANLNKLLAGATKEELAIVQANVKQADSSYQAAIKDYNKIDSLTKETVKQAEKTLADLEQKTGKDITASEQALATAQTNLANIKSTLQRTVDDRAEALLTLIENKLSVANTALDAINKVLTDEDGKNNVGAKDSSGLTDSKNSQYSGTILLATAQAKLTEIKTVKTADNIISLYPVAMSAINKTFSALNLTYKTLENSITTYSFSQTKLDTFKSSIDGQITLISSATASLQSSRQTLDEGILTYNTSVASYQDAVSQAQANLDSSLINAQNNVNSAKLNREQQLTQAQSRVDTSLKTLQINQAQYDKTAAGARLEDIALAKAQLEQASANLDAIKNQVDNNILKAPIDGVITKTNYQVGEQVLPSKAVLTMLTEANFEIEADIAETDISKIQINNPAKITFDAFGDSLKIDGQVLFIEPAETIIQGVIYYKVKIGFNPGSQIIKSGMTATVVITTAKKSNVLMMPMRAVIEKDNKKIVRILQAENKIKEVPVVLGLNGDGGLVEVISGVAVGDKAVTFIKDSSKTN